jgi:hypothetical protein
MQISQQPEKTLLIFRHDMPSTPTAVSSAKRIEDCANNCTVMWCSKGGICFLWPSAFGRSLPIVVTKRAGQIRCNRWSEQMQMPGQAECNRVVKWSAISHRNAKPRRFAASGLLFSPPSLNVWRTWRREYQRCISDSLLRKVDCVRSAGRREASWRRSLAVACVFT